MSEQREVPKGRLERVFRLAKLGADAGIGLVAGRSADVLAEQAARTLSNLRGLAAKVGQMASTLEGVLPETWEAPVSAALSQLRDSTTTSPLDQIVAVIEQELGATVSSLFAEFDPIPIASASIGQVHRARLEDGQKVAVKVQHPGIEQAIGHDLLNVRLLERLAGSIAPKGANVDEVFTEVSTRLREELDYRIEAKHVQAFAALHQNEAHAVVPNVVPERSTKRVITTMLFEGAKLDDILPYASTVERQGYAETLFRFEFRSILVAGMFNADPHSGNFLFGPSPQVAFLDFGCVQTLTEQRRMLIRAVHHAAISRDERQFAQSVCELLETNGGRYEQFMVDFTRRAFEPIFASPFHVTSEYLRGLVNFVRDAKMTLLRQRGPISAFPPELALMNRLQFGFYSLLSKLDVQVDYSALEQEILAAT